MKNIERLFKNEVTKKVLMFFNENQHCIDTAKGISLWVGYDVGLLQASLNRLVKENILLHHKTASISAYSYTNNKDIVKKIEKYVKNIL